MISAADYADQRYYNPWYGRFNSPDRSRGINPADPITWNEYAYVGGDPVNHWDPTGECEPQPGTSVCFESGSAPPDPSRLVPILGGWNPAMDLTGLYVTALDQITGQVAMAVAAAAIMGHDALTTIDAQSKLQDRLNNLGDCARIFGGAKASDLAALASKVNFYDGRPDAAGAQRSLNAVSGNGDQTSLADYTQYTVARTIVGNDGPLSKVVLGRDYFGDPTISQPDTLLHEFLHIAIGVDDPGLKAYLVS